MTAQVAEPDAVITLPWCDISAILGVVRRGPGDPTYRIEGVGAGRAIWKGWRTIAVRRLAARSRRSFPRRALKITLRLSS